MLPTDTAYALTDQAAPPRRNVVNGPTSTRSLERLNRAHDFSRRRLAPFRAKRLEALRHYVGMHYSEGGSSIARPLNVLKLACSIYLRQLIARTPRVIITAKNIQAYPIAAAMEQWVNLQLVEQQVERTFRLAALDAIFSIGIVKVGLCAGGEIEYNNQIHNYGFPFCDVIDLDDWVHDMNCKRWESIGFAGHRFRLPLEAVQSNESYDPAVRNELSATYFSRTNESGDERIESLTHSVSAGADDFEPQVELWERYLPRDQVVITTQSYPDGSLSNRPLRVQEWTGPECGMFHKLDFMPTPGQTMPSAPVHDMLDMNDLLNRVMIKLGEQAERQKTILGVQGTAKEDGERITNASDGEAITINFPEGSKEFRFGGADQQNAAFLIQCKQLFSYIAGNMDAMGGLAIGAETATQDQMLTANASKTIQSMQEDMIAFVREVCKSFGWYYWTDPLQTYHADVPIPGQGGMSVPMQVTPEMRQATLYTANLDLDPYSLQHPSPGSQLQSLMGLVTDLLAPGAQVMAQQGMGVNWANIIADYCKYRGIANPERYIVLMQQLAMQGGPGGAGGGGGAAAPTSGKPNGEYVRRNVTSPQSQETQMLTSMLQSAGRNQ